MNTTWCRTCSQDVKPTRGGFLPALAGALIVATIILASSGGPPNMTLPTVYAIFSSMLILGVGIFKYPEGACPACKTRVVEDVTAH